MERSISYCFLVCVGLFIPNHIQVTKVVPCLGIKHPDCILTAHNKANYHPDIKRMSIICPKVIEIHCCIECNLQPNLTGIIWKDLLSSHDVNYHVAQPLWQCCVIVLMFMWTHLVTLSAMRSRWTAKAIRCAGRPAVFVEPSPLTRERYVFQEHVKFPVFYFLLSSPSLSYLLVFFLVSPVKFEEMNSEMEENTELADNRLIELQKLQQDLQTVHQENNSMKVLPHHSYDFHLETAH